MSFKFLVNYLKKHELIFGTVEACTGGKIISTLAKEGDCGDCIYISYITYHHMAIIKELNVSPEIIQHCNLTSEEVARAMLIGFFDKNPDINAALSTTGVLGKEPMDSIEPGTVCFAWGFRLQDSLHLVTTTQHFSQKNRLKNVIEYALKQLKLEHQHLSKKN
jgi:nicotinamide-nucleotide amidase